MKFVYLLEIELVLKVRYSFTASNYDESFKVTFRHLTAIGIRNFITPIESVVQPVNI